jgi:hypothetical protein
VDAKRKKKVFFQPFSHSFGVFSTSSSILPYQSFHHPQYYQYIFLVDEECLELDGPAVSALGVRSQKPSNVLNGQSLDGWTKIYYLELLRASEGTLSCWSRLYLQSLASTPVSRRVDVRQAGRKNKCRIFITTWWKHVVPTLLSGIRVGKRRKNLLTATMCWLGCCKGLALDCLGAYRSYTLFWVYPLY